MLVEDVKTEDTLDRALRVMLWIFAGSIGFSLSGTLALQLFPQILAWFGPIYPTLVKAPTWTYMTMLGIIPCLMYWRSLGGATVTLMVIWGCFIGGLSELVGTNTGIPFGMYEYTTWLGPKLLDHVPYFIPLSWFAMTLICLDLASRISERRYERVLLAALFMVLWDVSLDPAMSRAFPFWTYAADGFYYGMPASNWAGWLVVSIVIAWGFEVLGGGVSKPHRHAPLLFALNCFFPFMLCLFYQMYVAFFVGVIATAIPLLAVWRNDRLVLPQD